MPLNQVEVNIISGALIRDLRKKAGLTQEDLAFDANIDQSTLSKVERHGPQMTSWSRLFTIADELGCVVELKFLKK